MSEIDTVVLIDGKNLVYRVHWVHRFLSSKNRPTSVLFGGFRSLLLLAKHFPTAAFVFVWDGKGETWRHRESNGVYKANRLEVNEDMRDAFPQIPIFQNTLKKAGFRAFEIDALEGDDLIGIMTASILKKELFKRVIIHSTDKDFYQLVTNKVGVLRGWDEEAGAHKLLFERDVAEEMQLHPTDWVKVRALIGDPTDNIPHVAQGLGPKTAIKMIQCGLDPSLPEFAKNSYAARMNCGAIAGRWKVIHSNYHLSKILSSCEDEHLDESVAKKVRFEVNNLSQESLLRDKKRLSEDSFAEFTNFIVEYEMNELFGQRFALWKLP